MKTIRVAALALLTVTTVQAFKIPDGVAANGTLAEPVKNETLSVPVGNCGVADIAKIQEKITAAIEKQLEQFLVPKSHHKTRRAVSSAAAVSKVSPDGTIKTVAAAKGSNDSIPIPPENSPASPILTNAHQLPPVDSTRKLPEDASSGVVTGAGVPGTPGTPSTPGIPSTPGGDLPPPPPPPPTPVANPGQGPTVPHLVPPPLQTPEPQVPPPAPTQPTAGSSGNVVQRVASKANAQTGTAVASAIAKRSVLQTVDTSGAKAIANAESHKGAATNIQTVNANGSNVGIANAVVDNKNAGNLRTSGNGSDPEFVLQNVAATGNKAVATAANNKGAGSGIQTASATGDEMSIASVSSARAKRELFTIQRVIVPVPEYDDGSYKPNPLEDDGSYRPEYDRVLIRNRGKRSTCISTKMDDNLRNLIKTAVEEAFVGLKKD